MSESRTQRESRLEARARIVGAAARLLREQGPAAVTTRGVAEAAGVQAPAIYRLFGDKDGLLEAVAEDALARYVDDKTTEVAGDDPVADLRAAWDRHVHFGLANPALYALLADPTRVGRSPAAAAGAEILRSRVHRVAVAGRLAVPEEQVVDLIRAAGSGAVLTLITTDPAHRDPELPDRLYGAVMAAVLIDAPTPVVDQVTAAAVALRAAAPGLTSLTAAEREVLAEWLGRVAGS